MTDVRGPFADFFGRLWRQKPLGIASGFVILILILLAIFADALAPYPFDQLNLADRLQGPSARHLLGTDQLGRDLLSRLLFGARIRVVHAFFAAYLGLTDHYVLHSERELNKGYADLHLEPFMPRHPGIGYGYLIEFKYLKRGEKPDDAGAAAAGRQALDQLQGYLADERLRRHPSVRHIGLALVFHGWELVWSEAVALP